jgi:hypothetical protein
MSFVPLIRLWLWTSALATLAGWLLSAIGQLNRVGYLVVFGVGAVLLWWQRESLGLSWARPIWHLKKVRARFRRWLPRAFALLAFVILLGGVLYPATDHTALSYRIPRVLQWLAAGQWHWIHTADYRMNDRACGIEWLSAPLLLFSRSDRLLFLLNFIPFLLLPGLLFSLLTRLGVRGRVAWHWMWLLPTGYVFVLQAGSTGNDAFPTVYALAALDFACRAWQSRKARDLLLSVLAAALLTGAKPSNLPLLLPWALLVLGLSPLLLRRPVATVGTLLLASLVSFIPTAALNIHYCGEWSGLKLEHTGMAMKHPLVGLWGNSLAFLLDNAVPPVFPQAGWWNQNALHILPRMLVTPMVANFEAGWYRVSELATEDWAGLGLGLTALVFVSVTAGGRLVRRRTVPVNLPWSASAIPVFERWAVLLGAWAALAAYSMMTGMENGARLIAPYYPCLLPLLVLGAGQSDLVRRAWWQRLGAGVVLLSLAVVIVTPGRPLWPAQTILEKIAARRPGSRLVARGLQAYSVYGVRADPLAAVRENLPAGVRLVGFLGTEDDIDVSLWRPLFQRRVEHILLSDSAADLRRRKVQYAVVGGKVLRDHGLTLEDWLKTAHGEVLSTNVATIKVAEGPQPWYLVRLKQEN